MEFLAKEIFTNVKDSSIDYVYETWNYTLTLRGANNYEPADMKAGVTSEKKDGEITFLQLRRAEHFREIST